MTKKNYIKIISGKLKGMKIYFSKNKCIKPTLNTIREKLFNWLNFNIKNKKCLDCFSGSGALSLESISRSAKHVTILEKNYKAFKNIKKNFNKIKKKKYNIINTNLISWLKKIKKKFFDIIFIDPPYKSNLVNKTIKIIEKNNITKKNSYIYIETKKKYNIHIPKKWIIYKKYIKSTNKYILLKKKIN